MVLLTAEHLYERLRLDHTPVRIHDMMVTSYSSLSQAMMCVCCKGWCLRCLGSGLLAVFGFRAVCATCVAVAAGAGSYYWFVQSVLQSLVALLKADQIILMRPCGM
jgi:hypothetical protein